MEYVEVIMNGEYMGLYGLMEPIDEKQLGITDGGSQGLHEYYYKKEGEDIGQDSDFVFPSVDERVPEKEEGLPDMILAGLELKNGNGPCGTECLGAHPGIYEDGSGGDVCRGCRDSS